MSCGNDPGYLYPSGLQQAAIDGQKIDQIDCDSYKRVAIIYAANKSKQWQCVLVVASPLTAGHCLVHVWLLFPAKKVVLATRPGAAQDAPLRHICTFKARRRFRHFCQRYLLECLALITITDLPVLYFLRLLEFRLYCNGQYHMQCIPVCGRYQLKKLLRC